MNNQYHELHAKLQDMLAGYADDMLDEQDTALVAAHLAGCEPCRNDVARQQSLALRLGTLAAPSMSGQLHRQLDQLPEQNPIVEKALQSQSLDWQHWVGKPFFSAAGWSLALVLLLVMLIPALDTAKDSNIPMVQDALSEYYHLANVNLPATEPGLATRPPATWQNAHVLGSWKTTVGGAPAEAYAVRYGDEVVLQIRIDETIFFNNPDVRLAVADNGKYQTHERHLSVLALPLENAGLLMVGETGSMPTVEQLTLKSI